MKMLTWIIIIAFFVIGSIGMFLFLSNSSLSDLSSLPSLTQAGYGLSSALQTNQGLGALSIQSPGKAWTITDPKGDYDITIADKNKQKTTISFCHKTITDQKQLPNKKEVSLTKDRKESIQLNRKIKDGKVCYQRVVDTEEYLKLNPVVEYQDINTLEYDLDWANANVTLYKNISGWNNTVNDIWVSSNNVTYKFGANDTSNDYPIGSLEVYKYTVKVNTAIVPNGNQPYIRHFTRTSNIPRQRIEEKHHFDFSDICTRSFNATNETADCTFNYYNEVEGNDTLYLLDVTFKSDSDIDPTISISEFKTSESIDINVTQENNFSHLAISNQTPYYQSGYGEMVLYMPFDLNHSQKDNITYDYTKFDNDGTVQPGVVHTTSGLYGNALEFSGKGLSEYVTIGTVSDYSNLCVEGCSFSIWGKIADGGNTGGALLGRYDTLNNNGFFRYLVSSNEQVTFRISSSGQDSCDAQSAFSAINVNQWHYYTAVYDNSTGTGNVSIYIDGSHIDSTNCSFAGVNETAWQDDEDTFIAGYDDGDPDFDSWNGSIDEVMIFNRSLNATEISDIYNNQSLRFEAGGTQTLKQFNITAGNNTINVTTDNIQEVFGSQIELRLGEWDITRGYNDSVDGDGGDVAINDSMVLWLHFDNRSGYENDTHFFDFSGNENNGTIISTALDLLDQGNGVFNGSYLFFDETNEIDFGDLDIIDNLTIAMWVNLDAQVVGLNEPLFVAKQEGGIATNGEWSFGLDDTSHDNLEFDCGGTQNVGSDTVINFTWIFVAMIFHEGSNAGSFYVNMQEDNFTNADSCLIDDTETLNVGGPSGVSTHHYNGSMDEIMIWNRTLSKSELNSLYIKGRANFNMSIYQNVTQGVQNNFTISNATTNILPDYRFTANGSNSTTQFYSPLLEAGMTFDFFTEGAAADTTNPNITFVVPTEINNTFTNTTNIVVNVTAEDETGLTNISIRLYNSSHIQIDNSTGATSPLFKNFTDLADGQYFFNATAVDTNNNINTTETRTITIETVEPNITFVDPTPANASTIDTSNIYVNISSQDVADHYTLAEFNDDILIWLRMDILNGSGAPKDSSSQGVGASPNALAVQNKSGKFGESFSFIQEDDTLILDQRIKTGNNSATGEPYSISAWIKSPLTGFTEPFYTITSSIAVTDSGSIGDHVLLINDDGSVRFYNWRQTGNDTDGTSFTDSGVVTANTWHHIVAVWNGSSNTIYVDNSSRNISTTLTGNNWQAGNKIGDSGDTLAANPFTFRGEIDEFTVFNRTLEQGEISALFNASKYQYENNFTELADGDHTFKGFAVDTFGNMNNTNQRTVTIDTINPDINITFPINNNTNHTDTGIDINFTRSDLNLESCWYSNDTYTVNTTLSSCSNLTTITWSEGQHNFTVWANDSAGNENKSSTTFRIDTTAPETITFVDPTETSETFIPRNNVSVNVTATDAGVGLANITLYIFNSSHQQVSNFTSATSPAFANFTGLADGLYYFNATATDMLNNKDSTGTRNVTVDTTPPVINYIQPLNTTTHVAGVLTISWTTNEIVSSNYSITNGAINNSATGTTTFEEDKSFGAGIHNVSIYVSDRAGNNVTFTELNVEVSAVGGGRLVFPTLSLRGNEKRRNELLVIELSLDDANGIPQTGLSPNADIIYPNGTVWIDNLTLPHITGGFYRNSTLLTGTLPFGSYTVRAMGEDFITSGGFDLIDNSTSTGCDAILNKALEKDGGSVPYIQLCYSLTFT